MDRPPHGCELGSLLKPDGALTRVLKHGFARRSNAIRVESRSTFFFVVDAIFSRHHRVHLASLGWLLLVEKGSQSLVFAVRSCLIFDGVVKIAPPSGLI